MVEATRFLHEARNEYLTDNFYVVDDDAMSVISQASFASSCSMASEVLERARMRKDRFWGKIP